VEEQHLANWIDNFIGVFSPRAKVSRLRYKFAASELQRFYDGASKSRRTEGWKSRATSANAEIALTLPILRDRCRELVRNNPYAARGVQAIANNVIGPGILTQFKHNTQRTQKQLNDMWHAWAKTKACDYDGRNTLAGLQRIATRSMTEGGECFIRLRRVPRQSSIGPDGNEIEVPPIQLQLLESDFLAANRFSSSFLTSGNRIIQGIEFTPDGKRDAYHLFKEHPGSFNIIPISTSLAVRIPADEVAHIYRQDRAGQIRGVPWLTPSMLRIRDFDDYEDAQLIKQKVAACFSAFIHDLEGADNPLPEKTKIELGEKLEPGIMEILPPGKTISFSNPPSVEGFMDYTTVTLHGISTGLGVPYAVLTGDLTRANFSSSRMGFVEFGRNIDTWRSDIILPDMLWPVTNWFMAGARLLGVRTEGTTRKFTPPKREMVDPTKEVPATIKSIRAGLTTLSEEIRKGGSDPDTHFEELQKDYQAIDKAGLILDSDARADVQRLSMEQTPSEDS